MGNKITNKLKNMHEMHDPQEVKHTHEKGYPCDIHGPHEICDLYSLCDPHKICDLDKKKKTCVKHVYCVEYLTNMSICLA